MKPESLHALLIDRELGELSPEVVEILEAWLAEHPENSPTVASFRKTLATAKETVRAFPELARPERPKAYAKLIPFPALGFALRPLAWAASIFILVGVSSWLGFHAGEHSVQTAVAANRIPPLNTVNKRQGPWARYALASDPGGRLTIVRRDPKQ